MSERELHGHTNVIETTLDTYIHEDEPVYRCTRCNVIVPRDEPEQFAEMDCDRYARLSKNITGGVNAAMSETSDGEDE